MILNCIQSTVGKFSTKWLITETQFESELNGELFEMPLQIIISRSKMNFAASLGPHKLVMGKTRRLSGTGQLVIQDVVSCDVTVNNGNTIIIALDAPDLLCIPVTTNLNLDLSAVEINAEGVAGRFPYEMTISKSRKSGKLVIQNVVSCDVTVGNTVVVALDAPAISVTSNLDIGLSPVEISVTGVAVAFPYEITISEGRQYGKVSVGQVFNVEYVYARNTFKTNLEITGQGRVEKYIKN